MLRVCTSNATEALLTRLARNLATERARRGPLAPARIVVPNRNLETYIKLGLAQASGVAANLEVTFLRGSLVRLAEAALPRARVVGLPETLGHVLALLHDEDVLVRPELAPVREYLEAAGRGRDAVDRRRCQLSWELSQLFDEYAASRPELVASWSAGNAPLAADPVFARTESWQRALWRAIFGPDGLVARRSQRDGWAWMPLGEMIERAATGLDPDAAGPLHVFGLSYVGRAYHRMLALVGRRLDVWIYTLNPCREFWEDVETEGELKRRARARRALFPTRQEARQLGMGEDPLGLAHGGENLALRLWGRPGRENVRLLNQLTDYESEGHHAPSAGGSLLARVQNDILDRVARDAPDPALRADGSITVIPCSGLRRELEVVAAEIWRLVRQDESLRLNEIALVVPQACKDAYLSHVAAVFGESRGLPHSLIDLPPGAGHRLTQAADMLLDLPLGSLSRRELLPLCTHPSVMARFPEADVTSWLRLADELGIVHGADRRDHEGTYIERDVLNWDQGLRRLALGVLMTGPRSGDETPVAWGDERYLPADRPAEAEPGALAFGLLVRSLIADARFARGHDGWPALRPLPEWLELMRGLLAGYLVPEDDEEATLLGRCLRSIEELEAVDLGGVAVAYRVAAELGRRAIAGIGSSRGQYLATGVTVASFLPMRAIPFRVVFVLGLGHGIFPRGARRGQLDLREARRAAGDVTPREQDLYMFLETLLCAREKVILSYVARDELTGEALPPSSVVLELGEILARYLPAADLGRVYATPPPLRRFDDDERLFALPLARRERAAKDLGISLRAALPSGAPPPELAGLRRNLPARTRAALEASLDIVGPPPRSAATGPERIVVPLAAIRRFLEDPLQGAARFRLRLREVDEDEDLALRDDETFETGTLARVGLLREVMTRALFDGALQGTEGGAHMEWAAVGRAYEELAHREELSGRGPTGFFRAVEREKHEAILRGWHDDLIALAGGPAFGRRVVRFGRAAEHVVAREILEPIVIELEAPAPAGEVGKPLRIEIVGSTELLVALPASRGAEGSAPGSGSLVFACRRKQSRQNEASSSAKDRLRAFFDHVALAACGSSDGPHGAFVARATEAEHDLSWARFRPVDSARARAFLAAVVRDMLAGARDAAGRPTGVHDYLLPCEAVFEARNGRRSLVEEVEHLRDNYFENSRLRFSSLYGPVPEPLERHDPPPADEAVRMAHDRFGLFFELLEEQE